MPQQRVPDRERWAVWVGIAWIFAAIACISGIFLVANFGFVEIPRPSGYGTQREPSLFIWALALGQSISSIMLAVIFSMLNSIYQNSCDQLKEGASKEYPSSPEEALVHSGMGVRLTQVKHESPMSGVIYTGCIIVRVNNRPVASTMQITSLITTEPTKVEFQEPSGEQSIKWIHLKPGQPLFVEGEAAAIPGFKQGEKGVRVKHVHSASPLADVLKPGGVLLAINGKLATSEIEAAGAVIDGDNVIDFITPGGEHQTLVRKFKPGPLHITTE